MLNEDILPDHLFFPKREQGLKSKAGVSCCSFKRRGGGSERQETDSQNYLIFTRTQSVGKKTSTVAGARRLGGAGRRYKRLVPHQKQQLISGVGYSQCIEEGRPVLKGLENLGSILSFATISTSTSHMDVVQIKAVTTVRHSDGHRQSPNYRMISTMALIWVLR